MHRSHEFRAERDSGPQHTSYTILSCLHAAFCILHWLMLTLSSAMDVGDSILSGAGTRIRLYLPQREHVRFMRTIMQFQMLDTVSRTPGLKDFSESDRGYLFLNYTHVTSRHQHWHCNANIVTQTLLPRDLFLNYTYTQDSNIG